MPDPWDEFVRRAQRIDSEQLERDEIRYKVDMNVKLKEAWEAVLSGSEDWARLVKRGITGNIIHFTQQANFRQIG